SEAIDNTADKVLSDVTNLLTEPKTDSWNIQDTKKKKKKKSEISRGKIVDGKIIIDGKELSDEDLEKYKVEKGVYIFSESIVKKGEIILDEEESGNFKIISIDDMKDNDSFIVIGSDDDKDNKYVGYVYVGVRDSINVKKHFGVYLFKKGYPCIIKHSDKGNIYIGNDNDNSFNIILAEDLEDKIVYSVEGSDTDMLFFVDGKKMSYDDVNKLDPDKVESVLILSSDEAVEEFGETTEHGVVSIKTKK
ncbi:hypothetical protein ACFLSI_01195, partial [Bacteroidota bacterium]